MKLIYNYLKGSFGLITALLLIVGCSEEYKYNTDYSYYDNVTLKINLVENDVLSVKLANKTHALTVAVTPEDVFIDPTAYIYEFEDNSIATSSVEGMLTLLKVGETKLTVKFRGNQKIATSCTLRVEPTLVSDLAISDEILVEAKKTLDLAPYITVVPGDADNQVLTYTVKEGYAEYAEIVEGSVVKGLKEGDAVILVSATDGSNITRELNLKVTGQIPMSAINLNRAGNIDSKTFAVGQVFDLASAITVSPNNASDKELKYEVVSGSGSVVSMTDEGVVTTIGAGDAEIKISPVNEVLNTGVSQTIKFKVDASLSWFERAFWFVDTTVRYVNDSNYVPDSGGVGTPESIIDGKTNTFLVLVKPEKGTYTTGGVGYKHPDGAEFGFIVDLGGEQEFNYFKWVHRSTAAGFQAHKISMFGSNDNKNFSVIAENLDIKNTTSTEKESAIPLSKCRYIKVLYTEYDTVNNSNVCVTEFNVGKK